MVIRNCPDYQKLRKVTFSGVGIVLALLAAQVLVTHIKTPRKIIRTPQAASVPFKSVPKVEATTEEPKEVEAQKTAIITETDLSNSLSGGETKAFSVRILEGAVVISASLSGQSLEVTSAVSQDGRSLVLSRYSLQGLDVLPQETKETFAKAVVSALTTTIKEKAGFDISSLKIIPGKIEVTSL